MRTQGFISKIFIFLIKPYSFTYEILKFNMFSEHKIGSTESWGFRLNLIDEGRKVLDLQADYAKFGSSHPHQLKRYQ